MKYGLRTCAAISVLALSLAACSEKSENAADNALANAENAVENVAADAGNLAENAGIALTPTPSPQEFADKAAKNDAFEIAAAEIAATNASSQAVKDFAKMMITAHKDSTAKIKTAAGGATPAVVPNATLTEDQNEDLADLRKLKGADFDKAYIDGQVDAHEDALDLLKKYAADGEAASLKATASGLVPTVEKHLADAKALDKD